MQYIDLNTLSPDAITQTEPLYVSLKKQIDAEKLRLVNAKAAAGSEVFVLIFLSAEVKMSVLAELPSVQHISVSPNYENPLESLTELANFDLKSLKLGQFVKKTLSFKPISAINIENFEFLEGLGNKSQHDFINSQQNLKKLHLKSLDLALVAPNLHLTDLYIHSTLKSENLLSEKFPNLERLHLHGLSKLVSHSFIESLEHLTSVNISYNSHLESFPKLKKPEKITQIMMYTCPNFCDVASLLRYENLETLVLTSHDKPLKMSADDFAKLKQLPKLKIVYTAWGRKPKSEMDKIEQLYAETNWINSSLEI